ncbi:MAG: hypothetical protein JXB39_08505 [Deltaproteobacteria bacterium]|nr:hypothetical protein [Deltaproteobacteria bacterium]
MTHPFRALSRTPVRLPWPTRAGSLGAALVLSGLLVLAVFVAWSLWIGIWRTKGDDGPLPVWIGPEDRATEGLGAEGS